MRKIYYFMALCCIPALGFALSWNNDFTIINNYNQELVASFLEHDTDISSTNCIGQSSYNYQLSPLSNSCIFNIATKRSNIFSDKLSNNGQIKIALKQDATSYCLINYSYDYAPNNPAADNFKKYSETFEQPRCYGQLSTKMISVINPQIEVAIRPVAGKVLGLILQKPNATYSFAMADCAGGKNCIVIAPDLTSQYVTNGSTLAEALNLQVNIDQFESLNVAQFIGVHNALISRHYTRSKSLLNLNYADPDNFITATEMLNSGVRMLEFDLGVLNSQVLICHNHTNKILNAVLCNDNNSLAEILPEVKSWVTTHPQEVIIMYIDPNGGINQQISQLDTILSALDEYIFTPQMSQELFNTTANTLAPAKMSKFIINNILRKNIIITTTKYTDNFNQSKYVFTQVENSQKTPLYATGMDNFINATTINSNKYQQVAELYSADTAHSNLLRINAARTILDYYNDAKDVDPANYINYFTSNNTINALKYPINVYALSMLGYACNSSQCDLINTDPRLYSLLWSWQLGYPLNVDGGNNAYINTSSKHFENNANTKIKYILCEKGINTATLEKNWLLLPYNNFDVNSAKTTCSNQDALFSTPTTSYWMDDVLQLAKDQEIAGNILVSYHRNGNFWLTN